MNQDLLIIIDGNALLHRAWHGVPPLTTQDGTVVNAVYGFANVVERILETERPSYLAVAWDLPGKTFRHKLYDAYKGTRKVKEPELYAQIPMIQELLNAYHIPNLSMEGVEADDIIGTMAKTFAPSHDLRVRIITGDLDALQLVDDDVEVEFFVKGLSQTKMYDEEAVIDRYSLTPNQMIDLKTLMGDSSDNLPGIAGIGKKTATSLLREYDTISGILEAVKTKQLSPALLKKLEGQEEHLQLMRTLVTILTDVKLNVSLHDVECSKPDRDTLARLYRFYGFKRLMEKYPSLNGASMGNVGKIVSMDTLGTISAMIIEEQDPDLFGSTIHSIWLSDGSQVAKLESPSQKDLGALTERLNDSDRLVCYDYKKILFHLPALTLSTQAIDDLLLLDYLLESHTRDASLETLLTKYANLPMGRDAKEWVRYMVRGADAMLDAMAGTRLITIYRELDAPLIPVLSTMEKTGILIDPHHLQSLRSLFQRRLNELTERIHELAGTSFNINSPSQLATILFERLALPTKGIKRTKTTYSTASSELEKLEAEHSIIPLISEYRELAKLQSTYVETLPGLIAKDGRIHTTFNPAVTATGRLSSSDPNLQNIPTRTDLGREIRKAFIAPEGCVLLALDYSQIELRLATAFSGDEAFLKAFRDKKDIHAVTASQVLGKPESEVTREERSAAKAINFGILYGMGVRNLARSTGFSQEEAKRFIDTYFALHPGILEYMNRMKAFAHDHGYVESEDGRRRYLPDIHARVPMLRASAERMAINMPIQGTQADLLKRAMIRIHAWLSEQERGAKLLLQVHDELIFEVREDAVSSVEQEVRTMMENAWTGTVPLIVNAKTGSNWGELESL